MPGPAVRTPPKPQDDESRRQGNWDMLLQVMKLLAPIAGFAVLTGLGVFEWGAALLIVGAVVGITYAYGGFDGVGKLFESLSNSEWGVKIKAWIRENIPQLANALGIDNVVAMLEKVDDPKMVASLLEAGGADKALAAAVASTIKPAAAGRPADNTEWKALLAAVKGSGVSLEGGGDIFKKPQVIRAIAMAPESMATLSAATAAGTNGLSLATKQRIFEAALVSRGVPAELAKKLAANPARLVNEVFAGDKLQALLEGKYQIAFDKDTLKALQAYLGRDGVKAALASFGAATPTDASQREMLAAITAAKTELMKDTTFLRTVSSGEMNDYLVAAKIPPAMATILSAHPQKFIDIFSSDAAGSRALVALIEGNVAQAINADTILKLNRYLTETRQPVDRFMTSLQELTVAAGVGPTGANPIPAAFTNAVVELAKDEGKLRQLDRGFLVGALRVLMQKGGLGGGDGRGLLTRAPELLNLVKQLDPQDIRALVMSSDLGLGERPQQVVEWLRSPSTDGRRQNVDVIVGFLTSMKGNGMGLQDIIEALTSRDPAKLHALVTKAQPSDLGKLLKDTNIAGLIQGASGEDERQALIKVQQAAGVLAHSPDGGATFPNLARLRTTLDAVGREDGIKIMGMISTLVAGGNADLNAAMDLFAKHKDAIQALATNFNLEGLPAAMRTNAEAALNFIKHPTNMSNLTTYVRAQGFTPEEVNAFYTALQTGDFLAVIKANKGLQEKIKGNVDALGDLLSNKDGKGLDLSGVLTPMKAIQLKGILMQDPSGAIKGYPLLQGMFDLASVDNPLMKVAALIEGVPRSGIRLDSAHDPDAERRAAEAAEMARRALLAIADAAKVNQPVAGLRQA